MIEPHSAHIPEKLVFKPTAGELAQARYFVNHAVDNEDTLLILGDSYFYSYGVLRDLSESFHNTILFNGTSASRDNLIKIIDTYEPDIVVFENAERCNYRFDEMVEIAKDIKARDYQKGESVLFYAEENNAGKYIIDGFFAKDNKYPWTEGKKADLFLFAEGFDVNAEAQLQLDIEKVYNDDQSVKILINGDEIYNEHIDKECTLTAGFIMPESRMLTITIVLEDAVSPFQIGKSADIRELGLKIAQLKITQ